MIRIAVFAPSYPDEIFQQCFQGLKSAEKTLEARGIDVELCLFDNNLLPFKIDYDTDDSRIFRIAQSDAFDGIITLGGILAYTRGSTTFTQFIKRHFPGKPLINCMSKLEGIPSISIDNVHGVNCIVDHLVETHGYSRIAILNGIPDHPDSLVRKTAFIERMNHHGLSVQPEWSIDGNFQVEGGERTALAWLKISEKGIRIPEALIACNDDMAFGFISKFNEHNGKSGKQIPIPAVCGFDNRDFCTSVTPSITSVTHPVFLQAKQALFLLSSHIIDGAPLPMETLIKPELVVRNSCGCEDLATASENNGYIRLQEEVYGVLKAATEMDSVLLSVEQIFGGLKPLYYEILLTLGQGSVFRIIDEALKKIKSDIPTALPGKNKKLLEAVPKFIEAKISEYNIRIREHRRNVLMLQEALHSVSDESQFAAVLSKFADQFNLSKAAVILSHELSPLCKPDQLIAVCMSGEKKYCHSEELCVNDFIETASKGNKLFCGLQTGKTGFGYMFFDIADNSLTEAREIARGIGARLIEFKRMRTLVEAERYAGLGKLLQGFAHHINTPLGNSITAISMIENQLNLFLGKREKLNDLDIQSLHDAAVITENNIKVIRETVELFRRLSSVSEYHTWETGKPNLLLHTNFQSESVAANQRGVELQVEYRTGDEPFPFPTDSIRFVIHELIENSIKYAFTNSAEPRPRIYISFFRDNRNLIIEAGDNGKGIPGNDLAKLFTPFSRMGKRSEGLGMGLFASKRIITGLLGGSIELDRRNAPGFHLKITVPIPVLRTE